MSINKVSEQDRQKILHKTVYSLPDNPSEQGYTANEIKQAMYRSIVDSADSVLAELDRLVDEINTQLNSIGQSDNLLRKSDLDILVPSLQGGKISATQIPGTFDDVLEGEYVNSTTFLVNDEVIALEQGKIYLGNNNGVAYRVSQNGNLVSIGSGLVLGETSETAFDGQRGKLAYDHISAKNNPHNVTFEQVGADAEGTAQALMDAHIQNSSAHSAYTEHLNNKNNPHSVTAEQVGADAIGTAQNKINLHNSDATAHADIRKLLRGKIDKNGGVLTGTLNTNSLLPNATSAYDLGSSDYRYNNIYATTLNLSDSATISGDLHVDGKVVAEGGMVVSVTEEVKTYNDFITLREGATFGLGANSYTGIKAKLYDGVSDGVLAFDSTGTARVGDIGQEQPLATRNEANLMTDKNVVYWDATDIKLKTSSKKVADLALLSDIPTELPASDVSAWAKSPTKPTYSLDEIQGTDALLLDTDIAEWAKQANKPTYSYDEILNTPSALPASDVPSWAKQENKPTYSYDEILGTPTIPAEQVQADWSETDSTKKSYIKNKPNNEYVSYNSQALTSEQKEQARENIGAGTSSFDGDYNSLTNAPTALPASDVPDWAKQDSKPTYTYDEILGRPTKLSDFENDSGVVVDSDYTHTDNNFTDDYRNKLLSIDASLLNVTATEINKVASVTINNGDKIYPDTQKNLAILIDIPENLSELTQSESYRTVSDTEKYNWNNKLSKAMADDYYLSLLGGQISGNLQINGQLQINGSIVQNGDAYETHAEQVFTQNDTIILRDNAVSGLTDTDYAGLIAKKYDGTNDGALVFDSTGTARVGDVGDEQPLTTRAESSSMVDNNFVVWNSANNRVQTRALEFADLPNLDTKYVRFSQGGQGLSNEQKGYARDNIGAVEKRSDIPSNSTSLYFHSNDEQGLINGNILEVKQKTVNINGTEHTLIGSNTVTSTFYAPTGAGVDGQILKSTGTGAPIWVTLGESDIPDLSGLYLTAVPKATSSQFGGLKADEKTSAETEEIKIDSTSGKLYSKTIPTSLPASDVYPWAKASTKPSYTADEVGAMPSNKNVVLFDTQTLTDAQKLQVRTNIGAGTSNFSGDYTDLTNKPTIPTDNASLTNGAGYITNSALNDYLKFTEQALSSEQKAQARTNIGAGTSNFSGDYNALTNKPTTATSSTAGLMSASDKTKLNAIESNAEQNIIEVITVNNASLPISNKTVNINVPTETNDLINNGDGVSPFATEDFVNQKVVGALKYKGSVNTYSNLPTSGMAVGDMYNVVQAFDTFPAGTNVAWNGSQWDPLGGSVDLSAFYDKTEIDNMVVKYSKNQNLAEQYKAIARANIGAISASDVTSNVGGVVKYDGEQTLTTAQKEQACENIGAFFNKDWSGDDIFTYDGSMIKLGTKFQFKQWSPALSIVGGDGHPEQECIIEYDSSGVKIYKETSSAKAPTITLNGQSVLTNGIFSLDGTTLNIIVV